MANGKVLILEDEPAFGRVVQKILSKLGYTAIFKGTAKDCENFPFERFDIIVSDYQMPGLTGIQLYRRILEIPKASRPSFILISGKIEELDLDALPGHISFLSKPLNMKNMGTLLRSEMLQRKYKYLTI